jgi:hypothetical protein
MKNLTSASWAPHGVDGWYIGPAVDHACTIIDTCSSKSFPCAPPLGTIGTTQLQALQKLASIFMLSSLETSKLVTQAPVRRSHLPGLLLYRLVHPPHLIPTGIQI